MRLSSLFVVTFGVGVLSYPAFNLPTGGTFFASSRERPEAVKSEFAAPMEASNVDKEYRIVVNIPATKLTLYEDSKPVLEFPVAVGQVMHKTPTGHHEIKNIIWNPWWYPPKSDWAKDEKITPPGPKNPLGPVKMELGDDIRIHGTTKDRSIGFAASHGCVRLHSKDASALAWYLQAHLSDKTDPSLLGKYKKYGSTTFYVKLTKPVPVELVYQPVAFLDNELTIYPDHYGRVNDIKEIAAWEMFSRGIDPTKLNFSMLSKKKSVQKIDITDMLQ